MAILMAKKLAASSVEVPATNPEVTQTSVTATPNRVFNPNAAATGGQVIKAITPKTAPIASAPCIARNQKWAFQSPGGGKEIDFATSYVC